MTVFIDIDNKAFRAINKKHFISIEEAIPFAARESLRKGLVKAKFEVSKELKEKLNRRAVPAREVKAALRKETRINIKGDNIDRYGIDITMPKRGFSLIRFVVGSKKVRNQKGIPVAARKRVVIKINKTPVTLRSAFIAKAKGKIRKGRFKGQTNTQVYQRSSRGRSRTIKNKNGSSRQVKGMRVKKTQSIASLSVKFLPRVKLKVAKKMMTVFNSTLRFRLRGKG